MGAIRRSRFVGRRWGVDGAIAALVLAVLLAGERHLLADVTLLDAAGVAALFTGAAALAFRRMRPAFVLVLAAVCLLVQHAVGVTSPALAFIVAVYTSARAGRRTWTIAISLLVLLLLPVVITQGVLAAGFREAFAVSRSSLELAWLVAAVAAGEAIRLVDRRVEEAERSKVEMARRWADGERLRIARELHDSLTHQISVVKLHAEVAVHAARKRGEEVPDSLLAIRTAAREADSELRTTLGMLRAAQAAQDRGLSKIPELVDGARAAGLDVELVSDTAGVTIPPPVGFAAYRVVQEALTNVVRHAPASPTFVAVSGGDGRLVVEIRDSGDAAAGDIHEPGLGLLGMRERVAALGGRLHAGPSGDGGFRVLAEMPLEQPA
jgi:signal transduction histidine kinase